MARPASYQLQPVALLVLQASRTSVVLGSLTETLNVGLLFFQFEARPLQMGEDQSCHRDQDQEVQIASGQPALIQKC